MEESVFNKEKAKELFNLIDKGSSFEDVMIYITNELISSNDSFEIYNDKATDIINVLVAYAILSKKINSGLNEEHQELVNKYNDIRQKVLDYVYPGWIGQFKDHGLGIKNNQWERK